MSFKLMINGLEMPSVNEAVRYMAKQEAIEKLVKLLPVIIASISEAPEDNGPIYFRK